MCTAPPIRELLFFVCPCCAVGDWRVLVVTCRFVAMTQHWKWINRQLPRWTYTLDVSNLDSWSTRLENVFLRRTKTVEFRPFPPLESCWEAVTSQPLWKEELQRLTLVRSCDDCFKDYRSSQDFVICRAVFWRFQRLFHHSEHYNDPSPYRVCVYVSMFTVEVWFVPDWVVLTPTTDPTQEVKLLTGRKLPPLLSRPNYTAEGISHDHSKHVTHRTSQSRDLLPTKPIFGGNRASKHRGADAVVDYYWHWKWCSFVSRLQVSKAPADQVCVNCNKNCQRGWKSGTLYTNPAWLQYRGSSCGLRLEVCIVNMELSCEGSNNYL